MNDLLKRSLRLKIPYFIITNEKLFSLGSREGCEGLTSNNDNNNNRYYYKQSNNELGCNIALTFVR